MFREKFLNFDCYLDFVNEFGIHSFNFFFLLNNVIL
jgi:hypothetical protein